MTITMTAKPASPKQTNWIRDMLDERPNWHDLLDGQLYETAFDILGNVGNPDPKFVSSPEASAVIGALLKIKPTKSSAGANAASPFNRLQAVLGTLKPGYYALPREDSTGTYNFYRIVEIEQGVWKGRRFVNQLIGNPCGWERRKPQMPEQLAIAKLIARDWKAAAKAYADHHKKCARCNADLSNPRSQIALVGEKCAAEWGWPW